MMTIQLRRLRLHNKLSLLHRILPMEFRHLLIRLFLRMLIYPKILDGALSRCALVDDEACCEFAVGSDLYCVEEEHGEVLAVVAY